MKRSTIMWDNSIHPTSAARIGKGKKPLRTLAFCDTKCLNLFFGGHEQNGSIADDMFLLRKHIPYPSNSTFARLGLVSEADDEDLSIKRLFSLPQVSKIDNAYEKTFAAKKLFRESLNEHNPDFVLPIFGTLKQTIYFYAASCNAVWAMFYCEFYRFLNYFTTYSSLLLSKNLGFVEVYCKNSLFPSQLNDTNACPLVLAALDALVAFIQEVNERTTCLLQPVGLQHMLPMSDLVGVLTNTVLVVKTTASKFIKKVPVSTGAKTLIAWRRVGDLLETCLVSLKCACMFSAAITHFVVISKRDDLFFDKSTLHKAAKEDPVGYGYKLRKAELARFFLTRRNGGYVPFDFYRFINVLSRFTQVDIVEYLPLYRKCRLFVETSQTSFFCFSVSTANLKSKFASGAYFASLYNSFGTKHAPIIKKIMIRMKQEADLYSTGSEANIGKPIYKEIDPYEYPAVLILFARNNQARSTSEAVNSDLFFNDMFTRGKSEASLWGHWVCIAKATFMEYNPRPQKVYRDVDFAFQREVQRDRKKQLALSAQKHKLLRVFKLAAKVAQSARKNRACFKFAALVKSALVKSVQKVFAQVARCAAKKAKTLSNSRRVESALSTTVREQVLEKMEFRLRVYEMNGFLQDLARRLEFYLLVNLHKDQYLCSRLRADGAVSVDVFSSFPSLQSFFVFFKCSEMDSQSMITKRNVLLNATKWSHFIQVLDFDSESCHAYVRGGLKYF